LIVIKSTVLILLFYVIQPSQKFCCYFKYTGRAALVVTREGECNMQDGRDSEADDPRISDAGTIAGRAPAPLVPKPIDSDERTGSTGANTDRDQAKERERDQPRRK
jgi:hypothetical protein